MKVGLKEKSKLHIIKKNLHQVVEAQIEDKRHFSSPNETWINQVNLCHQIHSKKREKKRNRDDEEEKKIKHQLSTRAKNST